MDALVTQLRLFNSLTATDYLSTTIISVTPFSRSHPLHFRTKSIFSMTGIQIGTTIIIRLLRI